MYTILNIRHCDYSLQSIWSSSLRPHIVYCCFDLWYLFCSCIWLCQSFTLVFICRFHACSHINTACFYFCFSMNNLNSPIFVIMICLIGRFQLLADVNVTFFLSLCRDYFRCIVQQPALFVLTLCYWLMVLTFLLFLISS